MSIKRQPELEIDWDVVRDTLALALRCVRIEGIPITEGEAIMRLARKSGNREHDAQLITSVTYALDESLVGKFRYEGDRAARINGLTPKGFELLNMLNNEWVLEKIRGWASAKGVPLTADIIIEVGSRITESYGQDLRTRIPERQR